jgi:7-cyano-7-deazaguanine synthase in queuosine biosynthesis
MFHKKLPLLLFTGGLDSTYMLYRALQDGPVDTLYIPGVVGPDKEDAEHAARTRILSWLHKNAPHPVRQNITTEPFPLGDHRLLTLVQPVAWLFATLKVVDPRLHSEVQLGYVITDQAATFHHEILGAWNNLNTLSKHEPVPMRFPLLTRQKTWIHESLPEPLRKLTWTCEFPMKKRPTAKRWTPCGRCLTCLEAASIPAKVEFFRQNRY